MNETSFYRTIAPHYDRIFPGDPAAAPFITRRLAGQGGLFIDAGCGSGTLALDLAARGLRVIGIDSSAELVALAEAKAAAGTGRPSFRVMDMMHLSDICDPGQAAGVSCLGNTLVHLTDPRLAAGFLEQAAALLVPGGHCFIQIINYDRILDRFIKGLPAVENEHIRFERNYLRPAEGGALTFRTRLLIKETGQVLSNAVPLLPLRKGRLEDFLKEAGFVSVEGFANFEGEPYTDESLALVVSAVKG